jgi:hypothetical protein
MADHMDFTDKYNTQLSPQEESDYQTWASQNNREKDTYDYDMRGAWKEGLTGGEDPRGHFPDTYKKPNHPTFSDESKYHGVDGYYGGTWTTSMGKDVFTPGPTNLYGNEDLKRYMSVAEPDAILTAPGKAP